MASEVVGDNMHMDTRVFKVADFKSEVISATFSFSELFYRAKSQFDGDPPSYENS